MGRRVNGYKHRRVEAYMRKSISGVIQAPDYGFRGQAPDYGFRGQAYQARDDKTKAVILMTIRIQEFLYALI